MDDGFVLVVGSAGIDVKGRPQDELNWGTPNLGTVKNSVGGVARNVAENLAHLEIETVLLTAVGEDEEGERVISNTESAGVNCDLVIRIPDASTGMYMALLKGDGELNVAISDFDVMQYLDSDTLMAQEPLFRDAEMIVIDATLTDEAMETVFELAARYEIPICADPTNPTLASKLCSYLSQLYLIVPNALETVSLCDVTGAAHDRDTALQTARNLVGLGTEIAVVTLGEKGIAYADSSGGGFIRSMKTKVVDSTGAGDAFTAASIFGLLNHVPVDEAMRLGLTAAWLTLQSKETVLPDINQELLYSELVG